MPFLRDLVEQKHFIISENHYYYEVRKINIKIA